MSDGVEIKGLDAFDRQVKAWFGAVEKAAAQEAVGLAKQAFDNILINSPQFSGDMVANWAVGVGAPVVSVKVDVIPGAARFRGHTDEQGIEPFGRGDYPAIEYAKSHATWTTPKLGQTIYLSNSAVHDEPYAWLIEGGKINFRSVNSGADHVVRNAATRMNNRYSTLTKSKFDFLRSLGV